MNDPEKVPNEPNQVLKTVKVAQLIALAVCVIYAALFFYITNREHPQIADAGSIDGAIAAFDKAGVAYVIDGDKKPSDTDPRWFVYGKSPSCSYLSSAKKSAGNGTDDGFGHCTFPADAALEISDDARSHLKDSLDAGLQGVIAASKSIAKVVNGLGMEKNSLLVVSALSIRDALVVELSDFKFSQFQLVEDPSTKNVYLLGEAKSKARKVIGTTDPVLMGQPAVDKCLAVGSNESGGAISAMIASVNPSSSDASVESSRPRASSNARGGGANAVTGSFVFFSNMRANTKSPTYTRFTGMPRERTARSS